MYHTYRLTEAVVTLIYFTIIMQENVNGRNFEPGSILVPSAKTEHL